MRVLLDECVPRRLKDRLRAHDVSTVPQQGWAGLRNGELLRAAEKTFDAFITVDRKLRFQQNLDGFDLVIVILEAPSNDLDDLIHLLPQLSEALARQEKRSICVLSATSRQQP